MLALLPRLGTGSAFLMKAESPGPIKSKLVPKIGESAKILYRIYLILIGAETLCLRMAGMSWFDSLCHAMCTVSTGGFSTKMPVWLITIPWPSTDRDSFHVPLRCQFRAAVLHSPPRLRCSAKNEELVCTAAPFWVHRWVLFSFSYSRAALPPHFPWSQMSCFKWSPRSPPPALPWKIILCGPRQPRAFSCCLC